MKVEEGNDNGLEIKNSHLIEVNFNGNAEDCKNNETMLGNNQEENDNPLNTKLNSPIRSFQ